MDFWQTPLQIRNLKIPRFIGGPLDNITDSPFRQLVRSFSTDELLYTEMRHVACVAHDASGHKALKFEQWERPLNFQVATNRIEDIDKAIEKILAVGVDSIDLNVGCPAKNVIKSGSGSALMADISRFESIIKHFRALLTTIPFTIKIRAGFKECNALEIAQRAEQCGVDAIAVHPRLQTQMFAGRPDYALIATIKKTIKIPIIVSGNIINWQTAKLAYEQTGADGFLIGRGIWARPWKLKEMAQHAKGNAYIVDQRTIITYALKHFDSMLTYYGIQDLYAFRKHLPLYIKGIADATIVRSRLVQSTSADEIRTVLHSLLP
ncbi:MAG TPA: tRNA-dihydrouridine synthase [Candidatus Babeliales bacterium]|jgi:tRNA-dihydrouridine synthase B|nr:tRNA-dihydrouridine synthase [Candidatus Babeliales bacterium]